MCASRKILLYLLIAIAAAVAGLAAARLWNAGLAAVIEASPPGASVFVDHRFRGCAHGPLRVDGLAPGEHLVRVSAPGFQTAWQVVELERDGARLRVDLAEIPGGALRVTSSPAGATVVLDGHVRGRTPLELGDLPPGRHALEVAETNYATHLQTVQIAAGETASVDVALKHRQVAVYRARLKADPGDIQAYNDLGELLYVLERYAEAADVFAGGLIAAGEHGNRSEPNRRNAKKLEREARNKHRHPAFQEAFNEAVLKKVAGGEASALLLKEFKRIPGHLYKRTRALTALVEKHPENNTYLLHLLEHHHIERNHEAFLEGVEVFLGRSVEDPNAITRLWDLLRQAYDVTGGAEREKLVAATRRAVAAFAPRFKGSGRAGEYFYAKAYLAKIASDAAAYRKWLEKAIQTQKNGRRVNAWRVELARHLLKTKADAEAEKHLKAAAAGKDRRDPSVHKARKLLKELEQRPRE